MTENPTPDVNVVLAAMQDQIDHLTTALEALTGRVQELENQPPTAR